MAISCLGIATLGVIAHLGAGFHEVLFLAIFLIIEITTAAIFIPFKTLLQQHTAPEMTARVTALSEAINVTAMLTTPFIGAAIATVYSVGVSFVVGGLMGVALGVITLVVSLWLKDAGSS